MSEAERLLHDLRGALSTVAVEVENLRSANRQLRVGDTDGHERIGASVTNLERVVRQGQRAIDAIAVELGATSADPTAASAADSTHPTGTGTVLVVEDDAALLRAIGRRLGATHRVLSARGVGEARALVALHAVDAILCDVHLPDGDVGVLLAWLAASRPELVRRTVGMTGGTVDPQFTANWPGLVWLRKPDDMTRIHWFIDRALGAG